MRFSNKISKYSRVSVPPLDGQKSPAEQWFVGGVFALSVCCIGKAAGLLRCLRASALFILRFFCLVFDNWCGRGIGVRCFLRLRILFPTLSPTWSPARGPALSPTCSCARGPTSTSGRHRLVRLVCIFRCKPARLHTLARSDYTSGSRLSLPVIHAPALGSDISALEASAASALHRWASTLNCGVSVLETSAASTLHCHASALETSTTSTYHPGASAASAGHWPTQHHHVPASIALAVWAHASALEALAESARASALPAPDVLIRALAERAIWARYPGIVRLCGLEVCAHSWSAGHSSSPSLPAAATATTSTRTGKRLTGQNRHSQHNNDRCFDSCLFHFRFLSLMFRFNAFLSPVLGSFYRDSGAGVKKVTPGVNFSGKKYLSSLTTESV